MVGEESGCTDWGGKCGLVSDHFRLNKFTDSEDPKFELVQKRICEFARGAHTRTSLIHDPHLARLLPGKDNAFFSKLWEDVPQCLEGTRVHLLREIRKWSLDPDGKCVYWLKGMAGSGKSTVACTVSHEFHSSKECQLGATFRFSRGHGDLGNAKNFFGALAFQLARIPGLKKAISAAVAANDDSVLGQSLREQWKCLIMEPLAYLQHSLTQPLIIALVIDAIDECESRDHARQIFELLAEAKSLTTVRLRVFVTSRPEIDRIPTDVQEAVQEYELHPDPKSDDIALFFEKKLGEIREKHEKDRHEQDERNSPIKDPLPADWPGAGILERLVKKAEGLFIYAATVCRFIDNDDMHPTESLNYVLEVSPEDPLPLSHLDNIYKQVLKRSVDADYSEKIKLQLSERFRLIIGSIAVLSDSLSAAALAKLLDVSLEKDVNLTLGRLRSVLSGGSRIRLLHTSFRDFLLDQRRCSDPQFQVNEKKIHADLANRCLKLLYHLEKDMCDLQLPGTLASEVQKSKVEEDISLDLQYACRYWVDHLKRSDICLHDNGNVHSFLQKHFLHWLEALSLMGKTSEGVLAITSLESIVMVSEP